MSYGIWTIQHTGISGSPDSLSFMDTGFRHYNVTVRKGEPSKVISFICESMRTAYNAGWVSISPDPFAVPGTVEISKDGISRGTVSALNFIGDNPVISLDGNTANIYDEASTSYEITVGTDPNSYDFTSIADALNSITDNSATNRYVVKVSSGEFVEPPFALKPFVNLIGEGRLTTRIVASQADDTFITGASASSIVGATIEGATGLSGIALYYEGAELGDPEFNYPLRLTDIAFGASNTLCKIVSKGRASLIMHDCATGGASGSNTFDKGFVVEAPWANYPDSVTNQFTSAGLTTAAITFLSVLHSSQSGAQPSVYVSGKGYGCQVFFNGLIMYANNSSGDGIQLTDGAAMLGMAGLINGFTRGIYTHQSGNNLPTRVTSQAVTYNNNSSYDLYLEDPNTQGYMFGKTDFLKTYIPDTAPFFISGKDRHTISVATKGGDFTSVSDALNSITDNSSVNRYLILTGPGTFVEPELDLASKPYVSVTGLNTQSTVIEASDVNHHLFKLGPHNEVSFIKARGTGAGYAAFANLDYGTGPNLNTVRVEDCNIGVLVESQTQECDISGHGVDIDGAFDCGLHTEANNNFKSEIRIASYNAISTLPTSVAGYALNPASHLKVSAYSVKDAGVGIGFQAENGAALSVSAGFLEDVSIAIYVPNVGLPPILSILSTEVVSATSWALRVEHPSTVGTFTGVVPNHDLVYNASPNFSWSYQDTYGGEFHITKSLNMTFSDQTTTDISTALVRGTNSGVYYGGGLTSGVGLSVDIASGYGYLTRVSDVSIARIDWASQNLALPANSECYIYVDENSTTAVYTTGGRPDTLTTIFLGRAVTNATSVEFIDSSYIDCTNFANKLSLMNRDGLGPIYANGSTVSENATPYHLDVTPGKYFYSERYFEPSGATDLTFTQYYYNGSTAWERLSTQTVNSSQYNNGTTLSNLTAGYFTKHALYVVGSGVNEKYFLVLGQSEHAAKLDCINAPMPTPPSYFSRGVVLVSLIYVEQGSSNINAIEDARPRVGFSSPSVSSPAVHGSLLGLTADDHTQYILATGTRAFSGPVITQNQVTTPLNPTTGITKVYPQSVAGRHFLQVLGEFGRGLALQQSLGLGRHGFIGVNSGSTLSVLNTSVSTVGSVTHSTPTSTSLKSSVRRAVFTSSNSAGSSAGAYNNVLEVWRGDQPNRGGYFVVLKFSLDTTGTGNRAFVGLSSITTAPTNIDPLTDIGSARIGLGINANTGNWYLTHNTNGVTPTVSDLGANFPVNTTDLLELVLYSPSNGTFIGYRVTNLSTNAEVSGQLTTNLPALTNFMGMRAWINNNANAGTLAISISKLYFESDS